MRSGCVKSTSSKRTGSSPSWRETPSTRRRLIGFAMLIPICVRRKVVSLRTLSLNGSGALWDNVYSSSIDRRMRETFLIVTCCLTNYLAHKLGVLLLNMRLDWCHVLHSKLMMAVASRLRSANTLVQAGNAIADLGFGTIVPPSGRIYASLVKGKLTWPDSSDLARSETAMRRLWMESANGRTAWTCLKRNTNARRILRPPVNLAGRTLLRPNRLQRQRIVCCRTCRSLGMHAEAD
jgi:hypothetical protein